MHIVVLQGSTRRERMGDRAAKWVVAQLQAREHEVALVDAAALQLPMLDRMWKEIKDDTSETHSALREKLEEYAFRPAAIVCYSSGPFGGVRAAMQLRSLLPEVGLSSIPSIQAIPKIQDVLDHDGVAVDPNMTQRS